MLASVPSDRKSGHTHIECGCHYRGIILSQKVDKLYSAGDIVGAQQASKTAKTWMIVSIVLGLVASIAYFIAMSMGLMNTTATGY